MSLWTDIRDTTETAAVLAGNYFVPGSSMITSKLVSDGSQEQLDSDVGKLAQLGTGGSGVADGNLSNWVGGDSGGVSGIDLGGAGGSPGSWFGNGEIGDTSAVSGIDLGGPGSSPATLGNGFDFSNLSKAKDIYDAVTNKSGGSGGGSSGGGGGARGVASSSGGGTQDDADYQKAEQRQRLMDKAQSLRQRITELRAQVAREQTMNQQTGTTA
jgi:hypothetical protein